MENRNNIIYGIITEVVMAEEQLINNLFEIENDTEILERIVEL